MSFEFIDFLTIVGARSIKRNLKNSTSADTFCGRLSPPQIQPNIRFFWLRKFSTWAKLNLHSFSSYSWLAESLFQQSIREIRTKSLIKPHFSTFVQDVPWAGIAWLHDSPADHMPVLWLKRDSANSREVPAKLGRMKFLFLWSLGVCRSESIS